MRKISLIFVLSLALLGCGLGDGNSLDPGKKAQLLVKQGSRHLEKQEYDLAIDSFQKALALEGDSAVAYNLLGMACRFKYNQTRHHKWREKEIAAFQKALDIDPNYWVALINLGATFYYQGEKDKAAPLFARALKVNPHHPEKNQLQHMIAEGQQQP